jgi:transposase
MTPPPPDLVDKDAIIATLIAQNGALAAEVERLTALVAEFEARLRSRRKGPSNSSVPPSSGPKASGTSTSKPKSKVHRGAHRPLHSKPTSKRDVFASRCACGADVSGVTQTAQETYDRVEIPKIEPDVTRVTLHGGICPCCAGRFKAAAPEGLEPGSPFGPNLRALVIYLRSVQAIPLGRLTDVLFDLLGLEISEGAIVNILNAAAPAFTDQADRIKADLFSGKVIASDETGLRVGKKNWWLWVFHHGTSALFVAKNTRARSVVADILGDWRPDYWISDRYAGQLNWAAREHQVCLAHLIRDVQYAIDNGDRVLAPGVQQLLKDACAIGRRRDKLADATLKAYEAKLEKRLDRLMNLAPETPAGKKLHKILRKSRRHLFVFVTHREIEPTNNGSERAVRPCTIYRKITNGFRTEWAAALYANTRSVVETGRRRSVRAIDAIRLTLAGTPIPTTS